MLATLLETGLSSNSQDKKPEIKEVSTQESARFSPQENVQVASLDAIASSSQASSSVVQQPVPSIGKRTKGKKPPPKQKEAIPQMALWIVFN